ncbi:NnrU family protein [Planktotalea arctica]|uniref:NnrU family protein n=1 Tax=Planktotalea arctica TaxID=1481893 RepID=UPI000A174912|nr:NnrU family protein [Planktotalea arctica]
MTLLIAGLILWTVTHYFKRLMPAQRAAMGAKGRGPIAILIVVSLLMMIFGYRWAEFISVWSPPSFFTHINNLLMLIAFFVFGMSATTGRLRGKMRHPMLLAVKIWAVAHLLVNGDLASIILFGGMLAWAVGSVILINRSEEWNRPAPGDAKKDKLLVIITLVTFTITALIHYALGVSPFGG